MTPEFDKLYQKLLNEAKCKQPTLRQLSDKKGYRWMACRENPYAHGVKRVYWGRKDGTFDYKKCLRPQRAGTEAGEECKDFWKRVAKRKKLLALRKNKAK